MQQKKLIIILADISGYTQFMLDNRTAAVHGQMVINALIESILAQVDIPLTLQEIEGDAVFLYAADPGNAADWQSVVEEVSRKLAKFFEAFIAQIAVAIESTPCLCAICRNADNLGLKIIVHAGEAVFHEIAGRAQVSGSDVILAHRLLKNSLNSNEYLLMTEQAYALLGEYLPGRFVQHQEHYEGFGDVPLRVRFLKEDYLSARDAVYELNDVDLQSAVNGYTAWVGNGLLKATRQQLRQPIRPFGWLEKALMFWHLLKSRALWSFYYPHAIPKRQRARGKRRTFAA